MAHLAVLENVEILPNVRYVARYILKMYLDCIIKEFKIKILTHSHQIHDLLEILSNVAADDSQAEKSYQCHGHWTAPVLCQARRQNRTPGTFQTDPP